MRSASSTTVGSGDRDGSGGSRSPRGSGGGLKQRQVTGSTKCSASGGRTLGDRAMSLWPLYTRDDIPGIKIGPVTMLVMSFLFIACVFLLHIWKKCTRS